MCLNKSPWLIKYKSLALPVIPVEPVLDSDREAEIHIYSEQIPFHFGFMILVLYRKKM